MVNTTPADPSSVQHSPSALPTAALPLKAAVVSRPAYPPAAAIPTQIGPIGIRFDFNQGARISVPERATGTWHVRLRDLDSGNILFESQNTGALVNSSKRWFVRFGVEIWSQDGADEKIEVLSHEFDLDDREVLILFPVGTLGDVLAWFPSVARFADRHAGARVTCALSALIIPLLQDAYPNLNLVTHAEVVERKLAETIYATYAVGLFFDDNACDWQPTDFRHVGLHRTAAYILGVDPTEMPPHMKLPDESRPLVEPYVCIAVQSSSGCKYWTNPTGWLDVVAFLRAAGYRVLCIDQKPAHGSGLMWTQIPHGAEDETGDRPLVERARLLRHADFFIGLSSGLTWLAWAAGTPVVLISGFTHPTNEFATPYRVINWHACNSCWNDTKHRFDHHDFLWCPRHAGTSRHFECSRLITASAVTQTIRRIPGFAVHTTTQPHAANLT